MHDFFLSAEPPPTTENPIKTTLNPKNCTDQNLFCAYWAKIGECENEAKFMKIFCKQSCGLCNEENKND